MSDNVYSSAKVLHEADSVQKYELGTFIQNSEVSKNEVEPVKITAVLENKDNSIKTDHIMDEIKLLANKIDSLSTKITNIENEGVKGKDIDAQVVQAIKDLKHYAAFFEQATFQLETKILRTSISIAQKIISIEVGENSSKIAQQTITHLLNKIKTASKVRIHLNPKDYLILKDQLNLESFIELQQDANVTLGGVVIASDLGNFDGNIEAKVTTMLETLDNVI